eukprot:s1069_g19.t1
MSDGPLGGRKGTESEKTLKEISEEEKAKDSPVQPIKQEVGSEDREPPEGTALEGASSGGRATGMRTTRLEKTLKEISDEAKVKDSPVQPVKQEPGSEDREPPEGIALEGASSSGSAPGKRTALLETENWRTRSNSMAESLAALLSRKGVGGGTQERLAHLGYSSLEKFSSVAGTKLQLRVFTTHTLALRPIEDVAEVASLVDAWETACVMAERSRYVAKAKAHTGGSDDAATLGQVSLAREKFKERFYAMSKEESPSAKLVSQLLTRPEIEKLLGQPLHSFASEADEVPPALQYAISHSGSVQLRQGTLKEPKTLEEFRARLRTLAHSMVLARFLHPKWEVLQSLTPRDFDKYVGSVCEEVVRIGSSRQLLQAIMRKEQQARKQLAAGLRVGKKLDTMLQQATLATRPSSPVAHISSARRPASPPYRSRTPRRGAGTTAVGHMFASDAWESIRCTCAQKARGSPETRPVGLGPPAGDPTDKQFRPKARPGLGPAIGAIRSTTLRLFLRMGDCERLCGDRMVEARVPARPKEPKWYWIRKSSIAWESPLGYIASFNWSPAEGRRAVERPSLQVAEERSVTELAPGELWRFVWREPGRGPSSRVSGEARLFPSIYTAWELEGSRRRAAERSVKLARFRAYRSWRKAEGRREVSWPTVAGKVADEAEVDGWEAEKAYSKAHRPDDSEAGSDGRLAGHFTKLAELQRPSKAWEDLLPDFAHERQALEIPAALLRFDPSKRQHPVRLLRNSFFGALLEDSEPLPPNLFDFSEQELSSNGARRHLKALQRKAQMALNEATNANGANAAHNVIELDPEPDPKRRRVRFDSDPEPICVRLISEDLSDIP